MMERRILIPSQSVASSLSALLSPFSRQTCIGSLTCANFVTYPPVLRGFSAGSPRLTPLSDPILNLRYALRISMADEGG